MQTLVLNAGYEPMQLVNWRRAICLVLSDKATVIAQHSGSIRTVKKTFPLPSVVRLNNYVSVVRKLSFIRCSRKNILLRDKNTCQYCGKTDKPGGLTIDHVVPRCKGGRTVWSNVVTACIDCNHRKGSMPVEKFRYKLMRKPSKPAWDDLLTSTHQENLQQWAPFLKYTV